MSRQSRLYRDAINTSGAACRSSTGQSRARPESRAGQSHRPRRSSCGILARDFRHCLGLSAQLLRGSRRAAGRRLVESEACSLASSSISAPARRNALVDLGDSLRSSAICFSSAFWMSSIWGVSDLLVSAMKRFLWLLTKRTAPRRIRSGISRCLPWHRGAIPARFLPVLRPDWKLPCPLDADDLRLVGQVTSLVMPSTALRTAASVVS